MKISIITATFNRKQYLEELILSVQKSIMIPFTDITWEHIVYDDCSTDGTEELFKDGKYKDVIHYRGEENKGQSFGRNFAIQRSSGDYIFLIDSDDVILQRTLFNFAKLAKENPETDWFVSNFLHVDKNLQHIVGRDYYHWEFKNIKEMLGAIWRGEHFIQSNVFFKKDLFKRVGGFDEKMRMGEDLDLYIRFLYAGAMPKFSSSISHLHRFHGTNLSEDVTTEDHMRFINTLKEKYTERLD